MDVDSDLSEYLNDFNSNILRAEANLRYFAHAVSTLTHTRKHTGYTSTFFFRSLFAIHWFWLACMICHNVTDFLIYVMAQLIIKIINLQFIQGSIIDDISSRKSVDELHAKLSDGELVAALKTFDKLRIILRKFNDDADALLENFASGPSTTHNDNSENDVETALVAWNSFMSFDSQSDAESLPPAPATYAFPTLPPSISQRIESVYSFTADVCNYRCGVFGTCEITHIIDSVECICCMVDFERWVDVCT